MTTEQIKARTKTVTRRRGWDNLKPGEIVQAVEKAMGLKRGEKIKKLCLIRIISKREELLNWITKEDVAKEGFPDWEPQQFIEMLCKHYGCQPFEAFNRIEFEYLED